MSSTKVAVVVVMVLAAVIIADAKGVLSLGIASKLGIGGASKVSKIEKQKSASKDVQAAATTSTAILAPTGTAPASPESYSSSGSSPVVEDAVDCEGEWVKGSCTHTRCGVPGKATETFTITTPASGGGWACEYKEGETREGTCPSHECCGVKRGDKVYFGCDKYAYETAAARQQQCLQYGGNNNGEMRLIPAEGDQYIQNGTCAMNAGDKLYGTAGCDYLYQSKKNCEDQCGATCSPHRYGQFVKTTTA